MRWPSMVFVGLMALVVAGSVVLSLSGAMLPGPDDEELISLRGAPSRRSHFYHHFVSGK